MEWLQLRSEFESLREPLRFTRLDYQWGDGGVHYHLSGGGIFDATRRFELLAGIAGSKLVTLPAGAIDERVLAATDSSARWYEALRLYSGSFEFGLVATQTNKAREHVGNIYTGSLKNPAESSALVCLKLSTFAGQQEIEVRDKKEVDVTGALRKEQYTKDIPGLFAEAIQQQLPLTLFIVDLDNFKKLNEKIGHDGADGVLNLLAMTMIRVVGHRGHVYRYGGDEFAVILPNHSLDEGTGIARRLHSEVSNLKYFQELDATVTMGVAAWPIPVDDIQKVFHVADRLLLSGKEKGEKNKVHISTVERTESIAANQWRLTIQFSPERPSNIPKHQLLDHLIRASYSQPLDFGRRYRFPLLYDRSNLFQTGEEGWIGAKIQDIFCDEGRYEVAVDGSVRLVLMRSYANPVRAVQADNALLEAIRFWAFASRFWASLPQQMHYFTLRLEGIKGALISIYTETYFAKDCIATVETYEANKCPFLTVSGLEGAKELLLQTCHHLVTAFSPSHGVSKDDLHLGYFERKAKEYLGDVRDHNPGEE